MDTLTYGYKRPDTGDKGAVVFPAMEDNIDRINGHNHDGANSAPLTAIGVVATVQSILAAAWVSQGGGMYKQTVTISAGLSVDSTTKEFRLSDGSNFYPKVVRLSTTQYDIYINDNTETVSAYYK